MEDTAINPVAEATPMKQGADSDVQPTATENVSAAPVESEAPVQSEAPAQLEAVQSEATAHTEVAPVLEAVVPESVSSEAAAPEAAPTVPAVEANTAQPAPGSDEYPAMTMEDVIASEDTRSAELSRGDIVSGTVVFVGAEGISVDVGAKIEGTIPLNQLSDEPVSVEDAKAQFNPGDKIEAYVVRSDIANGVIILSKKRAEQDKGWRKLQTAFDNKEGITVQIDEQVKGGLVASIEGVRAFLPASQLDVRRVNDLTPFVGNPLEVRLIELNRKRNRVIISRRAIIEDEKNKAKNQTLEKLAPNTILEGQVVEITDFGVFIGLAGNIDGLVHLSDLSWTETGEEAVRRFKKGDELEAIVLAIDVERERVSLGVKQLEGDPFNNFAAMNDKGSLVTGTVLQACGCRAEEEARQGCGRATRSPGHRTSQPVSSIFQVPPARASSPACAA